MKAETLLIGGAVAFGAWMLFRKSQPYLNAINQASGIVSGVQSATRDINAIAGSVREVSSSVLGTIQGFAGARNVAQNAAPSLPSAQGPGIFGGSFQGGTNWGSNPFGGLTGITSSVPTDAPGIWNAVTGWS